MTEYAAETLIFASAKPFLERWHETHSVNGLHVTQCFGLFADRPHFFGIPELVGVALWGKPAMSVQSAKWCPRNPSKLLELRRWCVRPDATTGEQLLLTYSVEWFREHTDLEVCVAYADASTTTFRTANWTLVGQTEPSTILMVDGESHHDRTLRVNKPYARTIQQRLKDGDEAVELVEMESRYIYLHRLRRAISWDENTGT